MTVTKWFDIILQARSDTACGFVVQQEVFRTRKAGLVERLKKTREHSDEVGV